MTILTLNNLPKNTSNKKKKRVGRGDGSKRGNTSGRGSNGQNSRSGNKHTATFEGGQTRFAIRLPKRGMLKSQTKSTNQFICFSTEDINMVIGKNSNITKITPHELNSYFKTKKNDMNLPIKILFKSPLVLDNRPPIDSISAHKFTKGAEAHLKDMSVKAIVLPRKHVKTQRSKS